ncbi:MAG: hypothetical protein ACXVA9_11080 [Bdellovibrionales bacterium]
MMTKMIYLILYMVAIEMALPSIPVHAQTQSTAPKSQFGNGVVNSAGQWAQAVGTEGAQANRNTADQLFKQSLQHEAQGIATLNAGLLSRSLTEAQQGMKADDQARHFAQTALQALKSGNTAGNVDLAGKYGTTEDQMRNLANTSSPYLPAVQAKLDGYGIKVDHDNAVIKTPFGTFPVDATPDQISSTLGKIANGLGFSADGIGKGVNEALTSANDIASKAMADAKLAAANAGRSIAAAASGTAADSANGSDKAGAKDAAGSGAADAAGKNADKNKGTAGTATGLTAEQDMQARAEALNKSREELLKKMGSTPDMFGAKDTDLFGIVHARYQEMRRQGSFNEYGQRMAAALPR